MCGVRFFSILTTYSPTLQTLTGCPRICLSSSTNHSEPGSDSTGVRAQSLEALTAVAGCKHRGPTLHYTCLQHLRSSQSPLWAWPFARMVCKTTKTSLLTIAGLVRRTELDWEEHRARCGGGGMVLLCRSHVRRNSAVKPRPPARPFWGAQWHPGWVRDSLALFAFPCLCWCLQVWSASFPSSSMISSQKLQNKSSSWVIGPSLYNWCLWE